MQVVMEATEVVSAGRGKDEDSNFPVLQQGMLLYTTGIKGHADRSTETVWLLLQATKPTYRRKIIMKLSTFAVDKYDQSKA